MSPTSQYLLSTSDPIKCKALCWHKCRTSYQPSFITLSGAFTPYSGRVCHFCHFILVKFYDSYRTPTEEVPPTKGRDSHCLLGFYSPTPAYVNKPEPVISDFRREVNSLPTFRENLSVPKRRQGINTTRCVIPQNCAVLKP